MTRGVLSGDLPFAIAHRGSRLLWPENTLVAFEGAAAFGFDWLETDLHLTADGEVVCLHDDTLDRTTDASGPVWEYTTQALRSIDAGFRFEAGGEHPYRGAGVRIPRLEDLLTRFPHARFVIDLKQDGLAEALTELLSDHGAEDRVIVGSFHDHRLREFRLISRDRVATSTGTRETFVRWMVAMVGLAPPEADAVQVPRRSRYLPVVTRRTVRGFHRSGTQVHVWTVNGTHEMERLLDMGVDGIITDRPDLLRAVMVERGEWTGRDTDG